MIIAIVGPTGVGKTKLSVELAKKIDAEIINCDSMQFYKGLDIGTAKVREEEKEGIPHHLFDIKEVEEDYSVADYQRDFRKTVASLQEKGKNIIVVGGTGLYLRAGLYDYHFEEESAKYDFSNFTSEELLNKIREVDPTCEIHVHNRRRLERALTKIWNQEELNKKSEPLYSCTIIGLTTSRDNLYKIIDERVDKMMENGLLEEVKKYYDQGIHSKALETGIGYKELYRYFDGELTLPESIDLIKKNSRHYAKRQYTFFNHQFPVQWFETNYDNFQETVEKVEAYLKQDL